MVLWSGANAPPSIGLQSVRSYREEQSTFLTRESDGGQMASSKDRLKDQSIVDILLRQEPDEEEDEEEDDNGKKDEDDDREDEGYSE